MTDQPTQEADPGPRLESSFDRTQRLLQAFELIAANPMMARERTEVRPPIRLLPVEAHHVFYDIVDETVVIQRVLYHSADWMHLL